MLANPSNSIIVRLKLSSKLNALNNAMNTIANLEGVIGAIDIIRVKKNCMIRDITIYSKNPDHATKITEALNNTDGVEVIHISDRTFLIHLGGKIEIKGRVSIKNRDELSRAYTPGVARVCLAIHQDPDVANNLTMRGNMVAVVTDGTAVLGLGDIGPKAALPVMEGKALLFKDFADINAFPICLDTKDTEAIIATVKYLAPNFGAINLEDIAAPRCFEIEERLKSEIDIPVFHDDQHGTAVVLAAGFINALKVVNKKPENVKVVVSGVGAAGVACSKMLMKLGVTHIIGVDRAGAIDTSSPDLDPVKSAYAQITNPYHETGTLSEVIKGADVFVGVSAPDVLTVADLKAMNKDPIVFAMANPTPEISPELAIDHVAVLATGRSDYPNQINNVLAFPGIFKGALACHASDINEEMKLAASFAIANVIAEDELAADYIIPSVFDPCVVTAVAEAVMQAAKESGVARK